MEFYSKLIRFMHSRIFLFSEQSRKCKLTLKNSLPKYPLTPSFGDIQGYLKSNFTKLHFNIKSSHFPKRCSTLEDDMPSFSEYAQSVMSLIHDLDD